MTEFIGSPAADLANAVANEGDGKITGFIAGILTPGELLDALDDDFGDRFHGLARDDTIYGGGGADVLSGGAGRDTFVFRGTSNDKIAVITDFAAGERIALVASRFDDFGSKIDAAEFRIGAAAKDGNDHLIYNRNSGLLLYDPDGKGGAAAEVIANIGAGLSLGAGNLDLI